MSPSNDVEVQFLSALRYHDKPINCVRFAGDQKTLASAGLIGFTWSWAILILIGDDGCIILWKSDETPYTPFELKDEDIADNVERWKAYKTFLYDFFNL